MSHNHPQPLIPATDHDLLVRLDERFERVEVNVLQMSSTLASLDGRLKTFERERIHREGVWRLLAKVGKLAAFGTPVSAALLYVWNWLHKFGTPAAR